MVGKSIAVNESLSLVPVSMGYQKEYAPDIVVYVEKTKSRMCISKVEFSPGPNLRAPVEIGCAAAKVPGSAIHANISSNSRSKHQQPALKSYPCMRPVSSVSPGAVCKINVGIKICAFIKYSFVRLQAYCALAFFAPRQQTQHKHRRNLLKNFVRWYIIKHYEQNDILENENLPKYVDESLIAYLKKKGSSDLYYFTQMGETLEFKESCIFVKSVLSMADGVFVVPVTFKGKDFEYYVIAYIKKTESSLK